MNNPFEDLIKLDKNVMEIEARSIEIDKLTDKIEERKRTIVDRMAKLESESVVLTNDLNIPINMLLKAVEKRKTLKKSWDGIIAQQKQINAYSSSLEKIILRNKAISPEQTNTIEVNIAQYEQLVEKQKLILSEREKILEEEDQLLSEIEKLIDL